MKSVLTNKPIMSSVKEKYDLILADFLKKYKYLPEQGSAEWLKSRKFTIGGSEIGTIAGTNYYGKGRKGIGNLVSNKLGLTPFRKNTWMRMGNLYEDIVRQYAESVFSTNIYETGCIPGRKGSDGDVIQTFSPDGLGVTCVAQLIEYFGEAYPEVEAYLQKLDEYNITLFEFKAPGSRIPINMWEEKTAGYQSQVLDGLDTIEIVNFGIYVDAVIRRCSLYNLGSNPVWNPGTCYQKLKDLGEAMLCGFIGIYTTNPDDTSYKPNEEDPDLDKYIKEIFNKRPTAEDFRSWLASANKGADYFKAPQPDLIDFGECNMSTFENMLVKVVDERKWKMYHSKLYSPNDLALFEELSTFESTYNAIGFVPWKMFNAEILPIVPQPGYVDNLIDEIEDVIKQLKELDILDLSEREEKFYELYPECRSKSRKGIQKSYTEPLKHRTKKSNASIFEKLQLI